MQFTAAVRKRNDSSRPGTVKRRNSSIGKTMTFSLQDVYELKKLKAPSREIRRVFQATGLLIGKKSQFSWKEQ